MVDLAVMTLCHDRYLSACSTLGDWLVATRQYQNEDPITKVKHENLPDDNWIGKYKFQTRKRTRDGTSAPMTETYEKATFVWLVNKAKESIDEQVPRHLGRLQPSVLDDNVRYITSRQKAILSLMRPEDMEEIYERLKKAGFLHPGAVTALGQVGQVVKKSNNAAHINSNKFEHDTSEIRGTGTWLTSLLRTCFADYLFLYKGLKISVRTPVRQPQHHVMEVELVDYC